MSGGIRVCFANPGTTELPIVGAFETVPGIKSILCLFEGVAAGAADGYGRMTERPAMTLLHLGPGLANGLAYLHNARRARSPLLNVIGEHATWHRKADPPLAMDIESLAHTVSGWVRTNHSVKALAHDTAEGIAATLSGQVSTLIVPHDNQLAAVEDQTIRGVRSVFDPVDDRAIGRAVNCLKDRDATALIVGGRALRQHGLQAAARIRAATGCDLLTETLPGYVERGLGLPQVTRIPYFPEAAVSVLSRYEAVVLAGAKEPVTFFGYEGIRSHLLREDQEIVHLCGLRGDVVEALEHLADGLRAREEAAVVKDLIRPNLPEGCLTPEKVGLTLAALQPENAIIVDEGLTTSLGDDHLSAHLPRHAFMTIAGGAIGYGMPCASGASVACPDRPVITLQADGSALYTVQALWTQAREALNITTLICANESYRILQVEMARTGVSLLGPHSLALTELRPPRIDWVKVAQGFGVPATTVSRAEELADELHRALEEPGPHLIEMRL
jgi:acetolactate synthase I/II/III large subunit